MRSRTSHAAKSGVGEHKARESESAQHCATGKSAWRAPTPKFGPGTERFRGLIFLGIRTGKRGDSLASPAVENPSHGWLNGRQPQA